MIRSTNSKHAFIKLLRHFIQVLIIVMTLLHSPDAICQTDSTKYPIDSLEIAAKKETVAKSTIDTIIIFTAKDTIKFEFSSKTMRLRGDARIDYKDQSINSEIIEIHLDDSKLDSYGALDSNGIYYGFPIFMDAGEEFAGKQIKYDFATSKGTISLGETELEEGFYFGSKIKRVSPEIYFIQDGRYTTCDPPYYYFGADEMKVVPGDKIFLEPLYMYVEDMPIFALPFGLYLDIKRGRRSGLVVPSFFFSANRGVVIEDLGYYYAASDYWDTRLLASYYTKGGYLFENQSRWRKTNKFDGSLALAYGRTRFNTQSEWTQNYKFMLNHNQKFNPLTDLNVNLDFKSENFNRQTSTNINEIITQNVNSRASLNRRFDNGSSVSMAFSRDQNIITDEYSQNINSTYSLPNSKPLNSAKFLPDWAKNASFRYSLSALQNNYKKLEINTFEDNEGITQIDSTYDFTYQRRVEHRPNFTVNPKLGFFTLSPYVRFSANHYFRQLKRSYDSETGETSDITTNGFYTEYSWNTGVSANTTLYGMVDEAHPFLGLIKPSMLGAKAFRHTYNPSLTFSYKPDQSANKEFYDSYTDTNGREFTYSRFLLDGGGIASRNLTSSLTYSDNHNLEMKVAKDSVKDDNILLLNMGFSGSYNFAADSLKFSDISMSFRNDRLDFLSINGGASFSLYDEDIIYPETEGQALRYNRVNRFLSEAGKGFARLTRFDITFSTGFDSDGFASVKDMPEELEDSVEVEELGLGERFSRRINQNRPPALHYGDQSPGYKPISIPWKLKLNLNYSYNKPNITRETVRERIDLFANADFSISPTWRFSFSGGYDFINKDFSRTSVSIDKDLGCWNLAVDWYPTGYNRGFHLTFGLSASQLKDLKYEKRSTRLYR